MPRHARFGEHYPCLVTRLTVRLHSSQPAVEPLAVSRRANLPAAAGTAYTWIAHHGLASEAGLHRITVNNMWAGSTKAGPWQVV